MTTKCFIVTFYIITAIFQSNINCQDLSTNTITPDQFKQYFPSEIYDIHFFPSDQIVYILPTNEENKIKQDSINEFYRKSIINRFVLPSLDYKILTDREALKANLKNYNVYAFGTKKGNLWISDFFKKAKDFPITINDSSIVADKIYNGNNMVLLSCWYNPSNYKRPVVLFIPQNIHNFQCNQYLFNNQFEIIKENQSIGNGHFYMKDQKWFCTTTYPGRLKDSSIHFIPHRQNDPIIHRNLTQLGNYLYKWPTQEQLSSCLITEKDIVIDKIKIEGINSHFDDIKEFEWLKPVCRNNKVIALAENMHHIKYNAFFLERILFAINTYDYYPLLICELPFSWGGFINYYVNIPSETEAKLFADTVLKKLEIPVYENIRLWNKSHPEKKIEVAANDMEHDFYGTINKILIPYLKKVSPDAPFTVSKIDTLKGFIAEAEEIMQKAIHLNIKGEFPFQTPDYMSGVLENIKLAAPLKVFQKTDKEWMAKREKIIIHNVSDNHLLGLKVSTQKCMFYGGVKHFQIHPFVEKGSSLYMIGHFLNQEYSYTKDSIYVIGLQTIGASVEDSIQKVNPKLGIEKELQLIELHKQKKLRLNEPVSEGDLPEFECYFQKLGYKYPGYSFRISDVNYERFKKMKYPGNVHYFLCVGSLGSIKSVDANIVVTFGPYGEN